MSKKNKVKVSVIIPTYNCANYLPETIDSVLNQDLKDIEIIVVDDASTDNTPTLMESYGDRVKYVRLKTNTGGPSHPRNEGLRLAKGDYIALLDSDDIMCDGKLREQVQFLDECQAIPLVFSNFRNTQTAKALEIDFLSNHHDFQSIPKLNIAPHWFRIPALEGFEVLMNDNFIGTPSTVLMRRTLVETVGYFDETLGYSEDLDYWIRVMRHHDVGYINKMLIKRRIHSSNSSSSKHMLERQMKWAKTQIQRPMSDRARARFNIYMANLHFCVGYGKKKEGHRIEAIKHYVESIKFQKRKNWKAVRALIKAFVPVR